MKKDPTKTPRSKIRAALRRLWLYSRERATALKQQKYACQKCGVKQSKKQGQEQKLEVHHINGIGNWEKVIDMIQEELLCPANKLQVLCPNCHDETKKTTAL